MSQGGYSNTADGVISSQGGGNGANDFTSNESLVTHHTAGGDLKHPLVHTTPNTVRKIACFFTSASYATMSGPSLSSPIIGMAA